MQIYGKRVAFERLQNYDHSIKKIYLSDKFNDRETMELIKERHIPV